MTSHLAKRVTLKVVGAVKDGGRWRIRAVNPRGRTLFFETTRSDVSPEKCLLVTYQKIKRDGEIGGFRFVSWEESIVDRTVKRGSKMTERVFRARLTLILENFRQGLVSWDPGSRDRSGELFLEGVLVRVNAAKNSWFQTPNGEHHATCRGVVDWMMKRTPEWQAGYP